MGKITTDAGGKSKRKNELTLITPGPVQGDIEQIERWIQAKNGLTMDVDHGVRLLNAADWRRVKSQLAELGESFATNGRN